MPTRCFSGESDVKPASNVHAATIHNSVDDEGDELGDVESRGEVAGSSAATALGCADWTEHHESGKILHSYRVTRQVDYYLLLTSN